MGTMANHHKIPPIPTELVEWLEKTEASPNRAPEASLAEVNFRAGKNHIIWLLRSHHDRQKESIISDR
jgi:hypothetical protein